MFGQTPSSLLEIRDWHVAREIDTAAAAYVHNEQMKREIEREQRDREFWINALGGQSDKQSESDFDLMTEEDAIARSPLGRPF